MLFHRRALQTGFGSEANYVGYSCAVAYGILIPGFLIYLIVKQSVTLALNQRFTSWAEAGEDKVTVHVGLLQAWGDHDKPDKEMAPGSHAIDVGLECQVFASKFDCSLCFHGGSLHSNCSS